jgi:hypothetical protein
MSAQQKFMDPKNESMLDKLVYQDFQRRLGSPLNEKQKARLLRTVHHYMEEVVEKGGDMSLQAMNKEVLTLVVPDFNAYLNRQNISSKSDVESRMKEDIGSRFTSLQNERTDDSAKALMPPTPDFRIPLDDETASPLSLFEQAKKAREAEIMNSVAPSKRSDEGEGTYLKDLDANVASGNPTIAKPEEVRSKPVLPQDIIIPQDEILSYKENEFNLVVYSADRDWYNNQRENRYNFSVSFNPSNSTQGFKYSPTVNNRFHNIVRIEMVKAIVPVEGIDTLILRIASDNYFFNQSLTILSLPSISINIDELESNMFGTDDTLDRAFATLQYDAQWFGNSVNNTTINNLPNPGFYAMIPKFLKCQRIYNPTPLATLQKMTIQLNRPNGTLVSSTLDTLDISGIFGCAVPPTGFNISDYFSSGSIDSNGNSLYYFIQTKTYFSINNFYRGDTIQIKGINTSLISSNDTAKSDFKNYFENSIGLTILDVASKYINDNEIRGGSYNEQNYANYLIVQARYTDPTLGTSLSSLIIVNPFGGSSTTGIALEEAIKDVTFTGARLINLSKQTQLTFRVITRDMDSTTRIRANNA